MVYHKYKRTSKFEANICLLPIFSSINTDLAILRRWLLLIVFIYVTISEDKVKVT